jgi:hypothetical protein
VSSAELGGVGGNEHRRRVGVSRRTAIGTLKGEDVNLEMVHFGSKLRRSIYENAIVDPKKVDCVCVGYSKRVFRIGEEVLS